ncbi:gephyrin [Sugiyamaella lignohabitans]|uniref:Gephyrin n=1 Tax=Sugiyamaella lignohabitans TaxID=796027 RepID=A0A167C3I6_9ASCO|nr:gephyrin [Sugiyamaella lignohabitans]ANB11173.1 gephyrin [Sugiyamaella lignohabitans]
MFRVHLIIVSDTCSKDPSKDRVIPAVSEIINLRSDEYVLKGTSIIPDEKTFIQSEISSVARDSKIDLIITSGGTGFGVRDVTPEAVAPLLDRQAPGLVQMMIQESLKITPMAALSRPVAGVMGKCIVITLPGSPKGACENLTSIFPILSHALSLACGSSATPHGVSQKLQNVNSSHDVGHHKHNHPHNGACEHSHKGPKFYNRSNDLSRPVTERARQSPYPMISVDEALDVINATVPTPRVEERNIDQTLIGYVIAENIYSTVNVPGYRASIVDGYAVGNYSFPNTYDVSDISHANSLASSTRLESNTIVRVTTGAPVPNGTFAVIPVESTYVESSRVDSNGKEEEARVFIDVDEIVKEGDNIREPGSDVEINDLILSEGTEITAVGGEIGLLSSVGLRTVNVYRKPIIGIMSTGDEVVDPSSCSSLIGGQVWDSNRPSLITACKGNNFEVVDLGIVEDVANRLESSIRQAYSKRGVDIIITTGGVSMGELDLLKPTIERALNGIIHFGRVAMKPGKPTTFGSFGNKLIFGLPGNPASALVTFHLFVLPCLRLWSGRSKNRYKLPTVKVKLGEAFYLDPRPEYQRAKILQNDDGCLIAYSTGRQRSSRVGSMYTANGLLCLPSSTNQSSPILPEGNVIEAIMIGPL